MLSTGALVVTLAFAALAVTAAAVGLIGGHPEEVDTGLYLFAFGGLLPLTIAVLVGVNPISRLSARSATELAAVAVVGLVVAIAATRATDSLAGSKAGAAAMLGLWVAWAAYWATRARRGDALLPAGLVRFAGVIPIASIPLLVVVFAADTLPGVETLLLSLLLALVLVGIYVWLRPRTRLGRGAGAAVDAVVVAVTLLLVSDITVYTSETQMSGADPELGGGTIALWLQEHQNFFLGPANDVIHGRAMLVDAYSNYGIGNIYFLGALFKLIPVGYGTFGLLAATGLAVMYAIAYAVMRLAGCSRLLAAIAMAAAIVSSVFHTIGSPATFPSLGAQRWMPAVLLVLLAQLSSRWPRHERGVWIAMAVIVGVSSVWSFEAFVYAAATFAVIAAYRATVARASSAWWPAFAKLLAPAGLAVVGAHLVLAGATLASRGQLPAWGPYIGLVDQYVSGPINRLPAPAWWPGILVGGLLFVSAVAVAAIVLRSPRFESEHRRALLPIAALTAFAVANFTYAVRFSTDDALLRTDLPVVVIAAMWIDLATRRAEMVRMARVVLAASGFWLAGLLILEGWGDVEDKAERTPLVSALPWGEGSIGSKLSRTWSNPPIDPRVGVARRLLLRYQPGESEVLLLLHPDLSVETLMRGDQVNLLPLSNTLVDDLVRDHSAERVRPVIDRIPPGTLMLTERFYLTPGATRQYIVDDAPALPLERFVLKRIQRRFVLRELTSKLVGGSELVMLELTSERSGGSAAPRN